MFLVTKCVQIQLILTCLVSDLNCLGLDVEAPQEKGKKHQQQKLVRSMKYCTLFYDGCGKLSISSPPPSSVLDVYSFLRCTLITLRHLLCHFIFVFSVQHLFVPFTCVHFSIKTTSWTLGVSCFYICIHLLFICVVWNAKRYCCVKACDRRHQPPHDDCSCDTC